MRIHALTTGHVRVKQAFLNARRGPRRRLDLLAPGPWSAPLPIHAWLVEHDDARILVDCGENANPKDAPFAHHTISPSDELPHALEAAGFAPADVTLAAVTHMHPDHYNGARHLTIPVLVADAEWTEITSIRGRLLQRISGAPLPRGTDFRPITLDDGPFGAFTASTKLTPDGRIILIATPGHTRGHSSVIAIDDNGRHVMLAGDTTDTLEQLHARRADAIAPKPAVQRATIDTILEHARQHPTIYLPSHDPGSMTRLSTAETIDASAAPTTSANIALSSPQAP